jgi:5-methylcytosine-specific restriction endonuclease McrA
MSDTSIDEIPEEKIRQVFLARGWSEAGAQSFIDHRDDLTAQKMIARLMKLKIRWSYPSDASKLPIPEEVRWDVWERDNFTCQVCQQRRFLTIDHVIPESAGGTLDPSNLQTLCRSCNSRKGDRHAAKPQGGAE